MGILERKVQEKLKEASQFLDIKISQQNQVNPKVLQNFQLLRQRVDKYIDKFYEIADNINKYISSVPYYYKLPDVSTKADQMIEELKDLRQIYLNAENGMIELKLSFIKEAEATKIPTSVWNIRNSIGMLFSLLKNMQEDSQKLLNYTNFIKGTDEDKRKLRWEVAYLANFSYNHMKEWAGIFNDRNVWIQSESEAQTKIFPEENNKALEPEVKNPVKEQAQPILKRYKEPNETYRRKSKQDWSVGSTVRVGFLTMLVKKIYPPGYVYPKTTYLLQSKKGQYYYFEPHNGLTGPVENPGDRKYPK